MDCTLGWAECQRDSQRSGVRYDFPSNRRNISAIGPDGSATGDVTAFSDSRLKENVENIDSALQMVESLSGYYFDWNESARDVGISSEGRQIGLMAQEVEAVVPEVVFGEDIKQVAYAKLVPLLIEAVKELSEKVRRYESV